MRHTILMIKFTMCQSIVTSKNIIPANTKSAERYPGFPHTVRNEKLTHAAIATQPDSSLFRPRRPISDCGGWTERRWNTALSVHCFSRELSTRTRIAYCRISMRVESPASERNLVLSHPPFPGRSAGNRSACVGISKHTLTVRWCS